MIRNKSFINFICAISIVAVLLVPIAGRTISVKAVGTTAAIAGTAFVLTGAVYLSYVALTQGEMVLPAAEELHYWLGSIGRKVSQYPSGASAYQEIYQNLARDPAANVIDGVWTWTQDRIISFVNDFSDTRIISNLVSYESSVSSVVTTDFDYDSLFLTDVNYFDNSNDFPDGLSYFTGPSIALTEVVSHAPSGNLVIVSTNLNNYYSEFRNYFYNGLYYPQGYNNGSWETITSFQWGGVNSNNARFGQYYSTVVNSLSYFWGNAHANVNSWTYPPFTNAEIYDADTDTYIPVIVPENINNLPSWNDPDNNNRPIVPWVPIPHLPSNITPPSGYVNPQWGFNLQDLLDILEDLAGTLINIGGIASLINEFAGLHGDEYYIEYNDGDTNYYTYYQPTIFDNDTEYITYNIDVSEQQDTIPVDINTIQLYTDNNYLDEIKIRSQKFGETLGEYFVFWHNSDPMTVYVIFGSVVVILIGAFIGKWGHS